MFSSQASPMEFCGSWCISGFETAGFTDVGFFRLPVVDGGRGDAGANFLVPEGFQVSAKTAHPQEAVDWLSFLVSDDQAAKFVEYTKFMPSNPAKIDTVEGVSPLFKELAADVGTFTQGVNVLDVLLDAAVSEAYLNATVEVLNRTLTPEQAVESIRKVALEAQAKAAS